MRITPIDIQEQKFKASFRGYDRAEVDSFLDSVAKDMEDLIRENSYVKEELARLNGEIERMKEMEDTLRQTVVSAQKMAEDFKENARREADTIVAEARTRAEKLVFEGERRLAALNAEMGKVAGKAAEVRSLVRGALEGFLENMEKAVKDA